MHGSRRKARRRSLAGRRKGKKKGVGDVPAGPVSSEVERTRGKAAMVNEKETLRSLWTGSFRSGIRPSLRTLGGFGQSKWRVKFHQGQKRKGRKRPANSPVLTSRCAKGVQNPVPIIHRLTAMSSVLVHEEKKEGGKRGSERNFAGEG